MRSHAARHTRVELEWTVLGLQVLGLLGAAAGPSGSAVSWGKRPPTRRVSMASVLRTVRHAARARPCDRTLRHRLRHAVIDPYQRHASVPRPPHA